MVGGSSTNIAGSSSTNTKEGSSDNTNEKINLISDDECQINENEYGH
ncbi:35684_t:CDS:2, partial [Gigaspora margarita]